jgi:hypothetical protein
MQSRTNTSPLSGLQSDPPSPDCGPLKATAVP